DRDWATVAEQQATNPHNKATPENLAYVIYTSGSTGLPKGVEVVHRGILRLVLSVQYVQLDSTRTLMHLAPNSFDASTFELWGALLHGAKCVLFPGNVPRTAELGNLIRHHSVTTLWLTASLFNTIIDEDPTVLAGLTQLLIGGETLSLSHVKNALSLLPQTEIINGYGPTECTTFACCYSIRRELLSSMISVPIGRPISNTRVYILDGHWSPVPVGIIGDLYIGGDGLARGYLNRPDLTAEKFIPYSCSDEPSERLYKTGDLARYLPDGRIEFIGRKDDQVKIRGFRIELGEIEAVLNQHQKVKQAVVLAQAEPSGEKNLVAYVVSGDGKDALSNSELRELLRSKLPDYMVPPRVIFLDVLPVGPNGKLDRQALAGVKEDRVAQSCLVAPGNQVERQLAVIWETLLGVEPIGVLDNFFDIGGHSLLAVRLMSRIENSFGKKLSLATLFRYPTIEQLAKFLCAETPEDHCYDSLVVLHSQGSKPPFIWIHGEASDLSLPRVLGSEQPVYGILHQAHDGRAARYTTVEQIAAHYLDEIRSVQPHGPYFLGGYCFGGMVAFEMAQQLIERKERVALLMLLAPSTPSIADRPAPLHSRSERHFAREVLRHWDNMARLPARKKFDYLIRRTRSKAGEYVSKTSAPLSLIAKKALCTAYLAAGKSLPPSLRSPYILDIYRKAIKKYLPKVYAGHLIIFTPPTQTGAPGKWLEYTAGKVETVIVPGDHTSVLKEENVQVWGQLLNSFLEKTRAGVNAPS
ncbi:MAG: amino acid adenylation domain-containing protein, partial [Chloroflexota bacterium]